MASRTLIVIIAVCSFVYLVSCGGGDGNGGEEFTIFDVAISILEVEPENAVPNDCPETANLKLSLYTKGNTISGFAELIGFGKVGESSAVSGEMTNNEFTLKPFGVSVASNAPPEAFFPASSITLDFQQFQGVFMEESDGRTKIEGEISGRVFENTGDVVICDSNFIGEFSGKEKMPSGCVSAAELTLDKSRDCPAEAISNLCNGVYYVCDIPESNPPPGLFQLGNQYEATDCITLGNFITNLELGISGGIVGGNFIATGEPLICRWLHSGL